MGTFTKHRLVLKKTIHIISCNKARIMLKYHIGDKRVDLYKEVELKEITNFISNQFSKKIQNKKDIEKILKKKVLGNVQVYLDKNKNVKEQDGIEAIRKNILGFTSAKDKFVLVISSDENEAKSWIAFNVALSYVAINKKVLFITADNQQEGTNTLFNSDEIKKSIEKISADNLDVLFNKEMDFSSMSLKERHKLEVIYDFVVIDGGNQNISAVDSAILVANCDKTKLKDMREMTNTVAESGLHLIGTIICENRAYKVENNNVKVPKKHLKKIKRTNRVQDKIFLKTVIKKQNKHIEKLEKIISQMNKKIDNNINLEKSFNEQNEKLKKELENNNEILQILITEKFIKMQEDIKEYTQQEIEEIQKNTSKEIESLQKKIKTSKSKRKKSQPKTVFSIDENIRYEDLEKTASYILPL